MSDGSRHEPFRTVLLEQVSESINGFKRAVQQPNQAAYLPAAGSSGRVARKADEGGESPRRRRTLGTGVCVRLSVCTYLMRRRNVFSQ